MRNVVYITATCVLVAAAIFFSVQSAIFSSRTNATSAVTDGSALAAESPTTQKTSPVEMMINHNRLMPAEQWDAF